MRGPLIEEVQRFRENPWIWPLLMFASASAMTPLAIGMYKQLILEEPWGNKPLTNTGLILLFSFVALVIGFVAFMLISLRLETRIDAEGIHYRMVPVRPRWRHIRPAEIAEVRFGQRFQFPDGAGFGYNRSLLRKVESFKIAGGKHVEFRLLNGQRLLLGTQNLEGLEWALKKVMTKEQ